MSMNSQFSKQFCNLCADDVSAMLALRSVEDTELIIENNVRKHVAAVLKNIERWLGNN